MIYPVDGAQSVWTSDHDCSVCEVTILRSFKLLLHRRVQSGSECVWPTVPPWAPSFFSSLDRRRTAFVATKPTDPPFITERKEGNVYRCRRTRIIFYKGQREIETRGRKERLLIKCLVNVVILTSCLA